MHLGGSFDGETGKGNGKERKDENDHYVVEWAEFFQVKQIKQFEAFHALAHCDAHRRSQGKKRKSDR